MKSPLLTQSRQRPANNGAIRKIAEEPIQNPKSKIQNRPRLRTVLLQIYREIPKDQEDLLGVVGSLLRGCGENSAALDCFDETLRRKPLSVGASLGRVLSLWNSARCDDAFDELKRFLSVSVSERHSMLLADMVEEFFDGEDESAVDPIVLIEEMREILARSLANESRASDQSSSTLG